MTLISVMTSLACLSMSVGVRAQDGAPAPATRASAPAPGEPADTSASPTVVTVTATRRREPAREVPMQVQAISADQLQNAGAHQLSDYLADQPGVNVNSQGAGLSSVTVRGVSTGLQTSATVGTYIDDVAFGSSGAYGNGAQSALDMGLLDLNHIEVLRGPQGTLYGAGAMGGLLKYVTNEPDTYQLSGKISLGASTTQGGGIGNTESAVVNVPLKEDVAGLRISAFHDRAGGFVDAIGAAARKNVNSGDSNGARISLLLEPTARFKLRLTALSEENKRHGPDSVDDNATTGGPVQGKFERQISAPEPVSTKVQLVSVDLEDDLGWARFESISSAQTSELDLSQDYTSVYAPYYPLLYPTVTGVSAVSLDVVERVQKQTQEFRLTSPSGKTLEWLGGLFYTHEAGENHQLLNSTLSEGGPGPANGFDVPSSLSELAAYADVTWKATPSLSLTGGIRIARNQQTYRDARAGVLVGGDAQFPGSSSETAKTYLATASYALTPQSNVYVRAANGYRPGGPNTRIVDPATGLEAGPAEFKHDSLWSYEAGYKAELLNKSLSVEASVYDIRWSDIQQYEAIQGLHFVVNGGKAKVQGGEFSASYKASEQWRVNGDVSYLDARLTQPTDGLGAAGAPLPNSARLSAAAGTHYSFAVAGHAAWVAGSERYVGDRNAGFNASASTPNFKLPSYWLTDLQAGVDLKRIQVSAYVRNAFNRQAILSADTSLVPLGAPVKASIAEPRTIGVSVSTTF